MTHRRTMAHARWVAAAVFAVTAMMATALAQKAPTPKPQDKLAIGEPQVRQLLLLMDTDKDGRISKQQWIKFMEAEFDRLDRKKAGQLDVKELKDSKLRASRFTEVGK